MKFPNMKRDQIRSRIAAKGGSYSLTVTAIVLAILIAVNILASVLPTSVTKYDIASTNPYSVASSTKVVVNALEKDVTIYWIVQADEEDEVIENLLGKCESLSSHITVAKKNPDVFPTFTSQHTSEDVPNNSLIVECGDKSRYLGEGSSVGGIRHGLAHFKERRLPLMLQHDHLCIGQRRLGRRLLRHNGIFYRGSGSLGGRGCLGNVFLIICHLQTSFSWHEKSQSADWPGGSDLPSWFYI